MLKTAVALAVAAAFGLSSVSAFAACADEVTKTEAMVKESKDATKQAAANKEIAMAKEKSKDEAACMTHVKNAAAALK